MNSITSLEIGSVAFLGNLQYDHMIPNSFVQHVMFRRPQNFRVSFQVTINHMWFSSECISFKMTYILKRKKKKNTYQFRWDIEEGENLTLKLYLEIKYFNVFCLKGYLVCAVKPVVNQRGGLISIISLSTNLQVPVLCTSIHKIKDKIISLNICFVQIISLQILRISFLMGIWLSKALHLQKYATS